MQPYTPPFLDVLSPMIRAHLGREPAVELEPHVASLDELAHANQIRARVLGVSYAPADEEFERMRATRRPSRRECYAWLTHPDDRVAIAYLRRRQRLSVSPDMRSSLASLACSQSVERGTVWSPRHDLLDLRLSGLLEATSPLDLHEGALAALVQVDAAVAQQMAYFQSPLALRVVASVGKPTRAQLRAIVRGGGAFLLTQNRRLSNATRAWAGRQ